MTKEGRKQIRNWTWALIVFIVLGIGLLSALGLTDFLFDWVTIVSYAVIIISLIGLFMYKKWGFYLFSLYLIFLLISNLIIFNFASLVVYLVIYGYFIWYKAFYKNLNALE